MFAEILNVVIQNLSGLLPNWMQILSFGICFIFRKLASIVNDNEPLPNSFLLQAYQYFHHDAQSTF